MLKARNSADAQAGRRRHREHVFGGRDQRIQGRGRICGCKAWRCRPYLGSALDYAQSNIRINAVAPGNIDTSMIDRFSRGTSEGRQAIISQ